MLTLNSDVHASPKQITEQILSIAPILPGQTTTKKAESPQAAQQQAPPPPPKQETQAKQAPAYQEQPHGASLIDLNSRPSSTVQPSAHQSRPDPIAGNPLHPTSDPKPVSYDTVTTAPVGNPPKAGGNLMDDHDDMNSKMASMSMHAPLTPKGPAPVKRTDTETSDVDVFVDAEG